MAKNKTPKADRLPLGKFLAWKSSDITSAGVFLIVTTYMSLFCTDYLGMTPLAVGNIILISNVIDFFTDLIAAYVIDNTKTKWGKARPYELGAVGMTLCTTLIFITPAGWTDTLKIVWVFSMYTFLFGVFNTFRTSANVPYLIRAFDNNRTLIGKVSSYGGIVTTMGSMVVSLTFPKMMAKLASADGGWTTLILIYMIPLTVLGLLRFIFVKENPAIDAQQVKNKVDFKDIWMMIKKNGYAWLYLLIMFFFQTIQSIGALSYYFKYIVGDIEKTGLLSIMSYVLLPTMFLFPLLLKKLSALSGDVVMVSPDAGGVERARSFAKKMDASLAVIDKRRDRPNQVAEMHIVGDVTGKTAVLVDDMIDTAGTLAKAANVLKEMGAASVRACATHPVFSGPAYERIAESALEEVIVSDTIPLTKDTDKDTSKITVLSMSEIFANIIDKVYNYEEISSSFIN